MHVDMGPDPLPQEREKDRKKGIMSTCKPSSFNGKRKCDNSTYH